jgi:photosystem II stability/assembly factor-like uncharacterized protein
VFDSDIRDVQFFNATEGVGITEKEFIATRDGGATWEVVSSTSFANPDGHATFSNPSISFINAKTGYFFYSYIIEVPGSIVASGEYVYKTTDGGTSWNLVNDDLPAPYDGHFVTEMEGYFRSGNGIYSTNNGGLTWSRLDIKMTTGESISKLYFTPSGNGIAIGQGKGEDSPFVIVQ